MYLFASSTISTYRDGIFTNLISDLIWLLGGVFLTFLLRYLIYKIPVLAKPQEFLLRLRKVKYFNLRGYWINQNAYNDSCITYDLMVVSQVGTSWRGKTIVTEAANTEVRDIYYKSSAEIVNESYLIGTWENINAISKRVCGAFHTIFSSKNDGTLIMKGKSLKESNFDRTTEIGSNWIALRVEISWWQRLGLILGSKAHKRKILNKLLSNGNRAKLHILREEEGRRI